MNSFRTTYGSRWYTDSRTNNERKCGVFIRSANQGFYHADYSGAGKWRVQGTIENMIWTFKNDVSTFPERMQFAKQQLSQILSMDLPQILTNSRLDNLTVCVIPRAKRENYYRGDQLFFRQIVSDVVNRTNNLSNGTNYVIRHTNTRTTHLDKNGEGGDGHLPYPGITKDTCTISDKIRNKHILLIDDLYTENINIDEDGIQALLDNGARSVIFYAVGKTLARGGNIITAPTINDNLPF
jgi:hypothetical protein